MCLLSHGTMCGCRRSLVKPGEPWADVRPRVRTLDLIMFRGTGLVSWLIARTQNVGASRAARAHAYTHVGLAVRGEDLPDTHVMHRRGALYIFESTQGGFAACGTGGDGAPALHTVSQSVPQSFLGAQLRSLDSVVAAYDRDAGSAIAWAPLDGDAAAARDALTAEAIGAIVDRYCGVRYPASCVRICGTTMPVCRVLRDAGVRSMLFSFCPSQRRALVCSALVACVLRDAGCGHVGNPENVLPRDFLPRITHDTHDTHATHDTPTTRDTRPRRESVDEDGAVARMTREPVLLTVFASQ